MCDRDKRMSDSSAYVYSTNSNISVVLGNILDSDCQYVAHQCNAVTKHSVGLAKQIFDLYPDSNIYALPINRVMGEIVVRGRIINMICQYHPGKAKNSNDSYEIRLAAFRSALEKIGKIEGIQSVAFPYNIGCGFGGGSWDEYYSALVDFARSYTNIRIVIYKLE